jgi:GNAT superfamily N-acetyltransferase
MNHLIRPIEPRDVAAVVRLVYDLAEYERLAHECHLTAEQLSAALFGDRPALFGHVAADADGDVAGFALWFLNFSTWDGVHGVYLEDLYVRPEHRGAGLGRALLGTLAQVCVERGYSRLQWSVLDWNEDALGFYKSLGAVPMDEWTVLRLAGEPLEQLGQPPEA